MAGEVKTIFLITVFTQLREREVVRPDGTKRTIESRDHRTWGWYSTYGEASQTLHRNLTDLHETCYDIGVIEEVGPGPLGTVYQETWWAFDLQTRLYEPAEKPADLAGVSHFAMG